MSPTIDLNNGKTRTTVTVIAALAWFILMPIGLGMRYDGLSEYGWVVVTAVALPLIGAHFMRPQKPKVITVSSEEEGKLAEQKFQHRQNRWRWINRVLNVVLVVALIIYGGLAAVCTVSAVCGAVWLQARFNVRGGKKLAAFMAINIVVMTGVVFVANLVG